MRPRPTHQRCRLSPGPRSARKETGCSTGVRWKPSAPSERASRSMSPEPTCQWNPPESPPTASGPPPRPSCPSAGWQAGATATALRRHGHRGEPSRSRSQRGRSCRARCRQPAARDERPASARSGSPRSAQPVLTAPERRAVAQQTASRESVPGRAVVSPPAAAPGSSSAPPTAEKLREAGWRTARARPEGRGRPRPGGRRAPAGSARPDRGDVRPWAARSAAGAQRQMRRRSVATRRPRGLRAAWGSSAGSGAVWPPGLGEPAAARRLRRTNRPRSAAGSAARRSRPAEPQALPAGRSAGQVLSPAPGLGARPGPRLAVRPAPGPVAKPPGRWRAAPPELTPERSQRARARCWMHRPAALEPRPPPPRATRPAAAPRQGAPSAAQRAGPAAGSAPGLAPAAGREPKPAAAAAGDEPARSSGGRPPSAPPQHLARPLPTR